MGKGSAKPPRFIVMRYEPEGKAQQTLAIVGKGITFDSGGLSIKPAGSMETMKTDMGRCGRRDRCYECSEQAEATDRGTRLDLLGREHGLRPSR